MANDLNELNEILFSTLRGVKDGNVDVKRANTVIGLSNALVNNAKVQIQAMKITGQKEATKFLSLAANGKYKDRYAAASAYAVSQGYKGVPEAIVAMGKYEFNKAVDDYQKLGQED